MTGQSTRSGFFRKFYRRMQHSNVQASYYCNPHRGACWPSPAKCYFLTYTTFSELFSVCCTGKRKGTRNGKLYVRMF